MSTTNQQLAVGSQLSAGKELLPKAESRKPVARKPYRSSEVSLLSTPGDKPVLWLVYDKRKSDKVHCLVSEVRWFAARARGSQDLQVDLQHVEAILWKPRQTAIGLQLSANSYRPSAIGNRQEQRKIGNRLSAFGKQKPTCMFGLCFLPIADCYSCRKPTADSRFLF